MVLESALEETVLEFCGAPRGARGPRKDVRSGSKRQLLALTGGPQECADSWTECQRRTVRLMRNVCAKTQERHRARIGRELSAPFKKKGFKSEKKALAEFKRPIRAVRAFPERDSALRLVTAVALHAAALWSDRQYLDMSLIEIPSEEALAQAA